MATLPGVKTPILTASVTLRLLTGEVKICLKGSYHPKSNSGGGWGKNQQQNIIATTAGYIWNGDVMGQNSFQVKIFQPTLILNFLCFLALYPISRR